MCFVIANQLRVANKGDFAPSVNYFRLAGYLFIGVFVFSIGIKLKRFLIYNLAMVGILVVALEIIFYALLGSPTRENKKFELSYKSPSDTEFKIGYCPHKDSIIEDILIVHGDTSFQVHYSIDSYNKRITPPISDTTSKYALFFGCSIGFGYGLEDNETIPYYFQLKEDYRSYNFAYNGYGTNHMLARLQTDDFREQISESEGEAYYLFFWDHIYRALGSMKRHTSWLHSSPYYCFENGNLIRNKTMKDGRPYTAWFYESLYQSATLNYFKIDFPLRLNDGHYELIAEMVAESKREYQKLFDNDQFYFAIMPTYKEYTDEEMNMLVEQIEQRGIAIIDLSKIVKYSPKFTLKNDAHPNSELTKMVALELINKNK